jgi:hypothetical protein
VSEENGVETQICKPNPNEFEDLNDCSDNPNHLGCIRATSFQISQLENGLDATTHP